MLPSLKRRRLLQLSALLTLPGAAQLFAREGQQGLLLSAMSDADERHWLVGARLGAESASIAFQQALPARAHHVAVSAALGCYIAVARRPGTWLVLGDLYTGAVHAQLQVPAGRHLYGHGVFSADARFFYTTESAFEDRDSDSGLVVEWAVVQEQGALSLARRREFPTQGVGPHELLLMPDGDTLVVANGGMRTHPATEREVLNLDSMQPSLVYLDRHSGAVLEQQFLPQDLQQNSIRHLDVAADGLVGIGLQFQGEAWMSVPLVATHRRGEALRLLDIPPELQPQLQQYVGSVRFDQSGRYLAASCPRGNQLTFWDSAAGVLLHSLRARDACGLGALQEGFVFSSGVGRLAAIDLADNSVQEFALPAGWQGFWDNHLNLASDAQA
jgi:hypothetical protein